MFRLSEFLLKPGRIHLACFVFHCNTGTGSDVMAPKKPQRPRPSHKVNHRHSSANQNETGEDNRHSAGNNSLCITNSPGQPNAPTDSRRTNQNDLYVEDNISAKTQDTGPNNRDAARQHRDRDSALTSPQKHREKRKHCSSGSDKHKHKKRKHSKDSRFEGQRIPHLVKNKTFQNADDDGEKQSDDYVLAKLFKKSGRLCGARTSCVRSFYKVLQNNKLLC